MIFDSIVLNYPSLSMITNAILFLIFFFGILWIPEKTLPTKIMAWLKLTNSMVAIGYVLTQSFLYTHPTVRAYSLSAIIFNQVFLIQILYYFPNRIWTKFSKVLLFFQILLGLPLISWIFYLSFHSNYHFDFHGHTIELEIGKALKLFGLYLILFISIGLISSIVKIFKDKAESRKANLLLFVYIFVGIFLNGLNYSLHKAALFDRGTFMVLFCITSSIGFFFLLVAFFNNTKDRTSFLYKLVGSGFLSFYLIYNVMNFFGSRSHDLSYDTLQLKETELISLTGQSRNSDFIEEYSLDSDSLNSVYRKIEFDPTFLEIARRSFLRASITNLDSNKNFFEKSNSNSFLAFYKFISSAKDDPKELETRFSDWEKISYFFTQKIYETGEKQFGKNYLELIQKEKKRLKEFYPIAIEFIESLRELDDKSIRYHCFLLFSPSYNISSRGYIIDLNGNRFLTYRYIQPNKNKMTIVGYSYESYRKYIHNLTINSLYVFLIGLFLFLIGIPFLLSRTLSEPLKELLSGVKRVEEGELNTIVKIKYQDEIGYLAQSFNKMVDSIKDSKQKLEDYAENLESKVEERTRELKQTLEQVESLKE
ncbi:MAG TPA: HAMP domain-containing protein [Leptospiraceae bacterium]|nr:HAMP domain-containing protein [Leptospiraceae bacterium]HMW07401.1 HAMP domain-containing protein [Leptospiraceae bacterium]HMX35429.1 HAMP domain-containing protein [Leptospiraceae bacterium]HMY32464.1 HAMP domain-containing protein [Leptospiraceae bacterium]HNA08472.1 HAMP domain-containing protein [Leptospiraceae bacterium]